jgi:hypothetical protein
MSLGIAAHTREGSILLTDSVTRKGDEVFRDSRKKFLVPSINAGVFASGAFADLASMVAERTETSFDDVEARLFTDLRHADQTGEPSSPHLLLVNANRIALMSPEYRISTSEPSMMAAGGWIYWHLAFRGIKINTERYRFESETVPDTLDECRAFMRELAWGCCKVWQNPPLVAAPLYELTFIGDEIIQTRLS